MGLLLEVGAYLQSLGLGTLGDDLYLGRLGDAPYTPDFAAALFEAPGQMGQRTHESVGLALERPLLEVLVRGGTAQYAAASARAAALHGVLAAVVNQTLSGVRYLSIDPLAPPDDLGGDVHNRPVFLLRFLVTKDTLLREGVTFAPVDAAWPFVTLSGIPVYPALEDDSVPYRTVTGTAVVPSAPGNEWGTPYQTAGG